MTSAQDRGETYLRLRAEAELRRVAALPRPEPEAVAALPAPLRGAARLVTPFGRRAIAALQPLAENAARALAPLAENAEQAVAPLAQGAIAALQPLAENAARALEPLANQVIGTVLPATDEAARRLHPLAWQAGARLQAMSQARSRQLLEWRWQARRATARLRATAGDDPGFEREELSPDDGLRRLRMVARALADAGAVDPGAAESVIEDLTTALAARSRIDAHMLAMTGQLDLRMRRPPGPPAGPYLAVPAGTLVPTSPESGLADVRLYALVIAPDRAVLTVSGRLSDENLGSQHLDPWPLFGQGRPPTAVDDRGNTYQLHEDSGWSDEENWGGILRLAPVPPAGTGWLDLTMSPGSAPVRLDLAAAGADDGPTDDAPSGPDAGAGQSEHMIDAAATEMLELAAGDARHSLQWHDLSGIADVVTALEAVGALEPARARAAVGRLVTLAGRLGVEVPPALAAAAPPGPVELPEAWRDVLANDRRRDGPRGVAPAAAVLAELDGARFVLAGLRSDENGADLHVMAWGARVVPHFLDGSIRAWSWWARDDRGRWHVGEVRTSSASDRHAELTLRLSPPLHPQATSLEVTVTGRSGRATATVPLDWRGGDE
jgi:hypothetical protein